MKPGYTLMWSEGTFLTQQHFQYWERDLHAQVGKTLDLLCPHAYGLMLLEVDRVALTRGTCIIRRLEARHPSGEWFYHDHEIHPPLSCDLNIQHACKISLVVPQNAYCEQLPGYEVSHEQPGYCVEYRSLPDCHHPDKDQELGVKRRFMSIRPATESKPDELSMVILSLHFLGGKTYSINEDDIPPCLISCACAGIMSHRENLMQLISERMHQLQAWLLGKKDPYALQEALLLAESLISLGQTGEYALEHPEKLFLKGARLMVQVAVLRGEWLQPEVYDHGKISILFQTQMTVLKRLLKYENAQSERLPILKQMDAHHHEINAIPEQYFRNHDWYLGVGYEDPALTWVQSFCKQAKMAAPAQLFEVLSAALPGVTMMPTHHVPHQIQIRSGFEYFKIVQQGSFWKEIVQQQSFKIYIPQPFHEAILTLVMVDVHDETI